MITIEEMEHNIFTYMKFAVDCHVHASNMHYSRGNNWGTDEVVHRLVGRFLTSELGKGVLYHRVPISWWQMFKRDEMPLWFTNRFPVITRRVAIEYDKFAVCPHIERDRSRQDHFEFLTTGEVI